MTVVETERLVVRRLTLDDAAFILELVNDPAWLRFIGDRGIRNLDDARAYLAQGPLAMYARRGFGLFAVADRTSGELLGMCGLLQRDTLPDVDLGFAFLPAHRGRGLAQESAAAVMEYARSTLQLPRLAAITSPANAASIALLEKLGFRFARLVQLVPGQPASKLFGRVL